MAHWLVNLAYWASSRPIKDPVSKQKRTTLGKEYWRLSFALHTSVH